MSGELWVGPRDDPDRLRLGPAVASGTEGVIYRGFVDVASGPVEVAIKMLQPGHLGHLAEWTTRWREQVELLRRVEVPGLVAVRDGFVGSLPHPRGHHDGSTASLYLVMDWVEGLPLDRWARSVEVAEPEQLLLALVPVAAALDLLHSGAATAGTPVVHRDVKPANILMRPGGDTVLVDVGSVRGLIDDLQRSGVVGTPGYIAPEVRAEARYSPAADRYSLGAVAFTLLTGAEPPPEGHIEDLGQRLSEAPMLQGRSDLVEHVLAMLDPVPEHRPTCLANWVAQLRRSSLVALPGDVALAPRAPGRNPDHGLRPPADRQRPRRPRRRSLVALGAVLLAVGGLGAAATLAQQDEPERASVGTAPTSSTASISTTSSTPVTAVLTTSTTLTVSTIDEVSSSIFSDFLGAWRYHGSELTISKDGRVTFEFRTYRFCGQNPPPCDTLTDDFVYPGGFAEGKLTSRSGDVASGRVLESNELSSYPIGELRVTLDRDQDGLLVVPGDDLFCGPEAAPGACGA